METEPEFLQLTGMPMATPNDVTKDIRFALEASNGGPVFCRGPYGVIAQIASGLGSALDLLRPTLTGTPVAMSPQSVREVQINKSLLEDKVVVQLITTLGIPYIFAIPSGMTQAIADRIQSEGSKTTDLGNA